MLDKLAEFEQLQAQARLGGGQKYIDRHRARGKLLVRERIELLVDRDTPFPRALHPGRLGHRQEPRRQCRNRHRGGLRSRMRHLRQRPHQPGRLFEPLQPGQDPARPGHRQGEPASADQSGRVGWRRPSRPGRGLHHRRQVVPQPHPDCRGWAFRPSPWCSETPPPGGAYVPAMCDYSVMVKERAKVFLGGPSAGEDGHRRGVDRRGAGWSRDALPNLRTLRLLRPGRTRRPSDRSRDRRSSQLAQARIRTDPAGRRSGPRPRGSARDHPPGPAGSLRHPRGARPGPRRFPVRGVQGALRDFAGDRLGFDPRIRRSA